MFLQGTQKDGNAGRGLADQGQGHPVVESHQGIATGLGVVALVLCVCKKKERKGGSGQGGEGEKKGKREGKN